MLFLSKVHGKNAALENKNRKKEKNKKEKVPDYDISYVAANQYNWCCMYDKVLGLVSCLCWYNDVIISEVVVQLFRSKDHFSRTIETTAMR